MSQKETPDTRERLLQAAGEVFARRGFKAATIREIAGIAQANVAAVNYHFGDKQGLYSAVLKHTLSSAIQKYPPELGTNPDSTPEERLHAFIRSFLMRILDEGLPAWHGKLMAREIAEPTAALNELTDKLIRPLYEYLTEIVRKLLGDNPDEETVRVCSICIMGQCLYYRHGRPVILRLGSPEMERIDIRRLAGLLTQFSLGAIRSFSGEPNSK